MPPRMRKGQAPRSASSSAARQRPAASASDFRENQVYVGTLRLFYARIDYLLGRRADWIPCRDAVAKLSLPAEAPGLQGLCSLTHQGADAPPPAKVAPGTRSLRPP